MVADKTSLRPRLVSHPCELAETGAFFLGRKRRVFSFYRYGQPFSATRSSKPVIVTDGTPEARLAAAELCGGALPVSRRCRLGAGARTGGLSLRDISGGGARGWFRNQ